MAYIPLRKAVEFLGLHPKTLRRYADEGNINWFGVSIFVYKEKNRHYSSLTIL